MSLGGAICMPVKLGREFSNPSPSPRKVIGQALHDSNRTNILRPIRHVAYHPLPLSWIRHLYLDDSQLLVQLLGKASPLDSPCSVFAQTIGDKFVYGHPRLFQEGHAPTHSIVDQSITMMYNGMQ